MLRYDLIFDGDIAEGQNLNDVKEKLATLYNVNVSEIERLFATLPIIVKRDLDYATAIRDKAEFETTGARCRLVEPVDQKGSASVESNQRKTKSRSARRYSIWHPFYMSFYSKPFYRDVAQHWRGFAFLYLILLVALLSLLASAEIHYRMAGYIDRYGAAFVDQLPTVTIRNGRTTIDQPEPYTITDPESGQPVAIIDTTGKTRSLYDSEAMILLTQDRLIVKKDLREVRTFDLSEIDAFQIDRQSARIWMDMMRSWSAAIVFPFLLAGNLIYRLLQVLVYSAIGMLVARTQKVSLTYQALISVSIMAITPVILLDLVVPLAGVSPGFWGMFAVILSMGFLYYGIRANRIQPPPIEPNTPER